MYQEEAYDVAPETPLDGEMEDQAVAEPIAVIGFCGRFPGAPDTDTFWHNLRDGVESVKFFTDAELDDAHIDPEIRNNPRYVPADAVLDDIDLFDADFFNYAPREAEIMDPQHRLFLECAWEAMETAGYNPDTYGGRVGVFGGSGLSSYLIRNLLKNSAFVDSVGSFQTMLGNSQDFLATKVSYKMNLMGPSLNTNTLCSSSSVSVHLACQSLWDYQTDMNLAGGVSIQISRNEAFFYQEGGIGAFDGHCRAFDARAGGTVSGSGLGILVLKRLEDAQADGDTVHALIVGSAVNNDGSVKLSYTAPSIDGQAEVIAEALSVGGIDPATVTYVECHGTGTSLGDPIEIAGLTKAFRAFTDKVGYCAVGSVKTNIGHLVTAGGVASIIKTILALKHRRIPPSLNFEKPNPKINFADSPFFVNTHLRPWEAPDGLPLRAGVSSFGIGGTNAHTVLEEAPAAPASEGARPHLLLPFSARSQAALDAMRARLAAHLRAHPEQALADVAHTLQVGRKVFTHRAFLVAADHAGATAVLDGEQPGLMQAETASTDRRAVFLFSGQGSQYVDMARGVYDAEPVFRDHVDRCAALLQAPLGVDIRTVIMPESDPEGAAARLQRTALTQPALFTIASAQAHLLMSWGIEPHAMLGHSIGEYVAAYLAGVFSLEDALSLVAERGRLIDGLPAGDMLAVSQPAADLHLPQDLSLAAVNSAEACVVSGPADAVAAFKARLTAENVSATSLHTSHAFHSSMMDAILEPFRAKLASVTRTAPTRPFVSNVTGTWITADEACDPDYWVRHLRGTVRFHDGLTTLAATPDQVLVEVGPGRTLAGLAKQFRGQTWAGVVHTLRHPREKADDAAFLTESLGKLWLAGVTPEWDGYDQDRFLQRVPLPTYPFERSRYWIEPDMRGYKTGEEAPVADQQVGVRKQDPGDWFYVPSWQSTAPTPLPREVPPGRVWVLFAQEDAAAEALSGRLVDEGQVMVTVTTGRTYAKLEHGIYQIRPRDRADYAALVADLEREQLAPDGLLVFDSFCDGDAVRRFDAVRTLGEAFHAGEDGPGLPLIYVRGRPAGPVDVPHDLDTAMVQGLLRVLPHELPRLRCRLIDLHLGEGAGHRRRLTDRLFAELHAGDRASWTALQHTGRWTHGFVPAPLAKQALGSVRDGGVYLVIGGLAGTGLKIAEYLGGQTRLKLILTGPDGFPEPAQRQALTDPVQRETAAVLARLEAAGSSVETHRLDPTRIAELDGLWTEVRRRHGHIAGVFFCEGPQGPDWIGALGELTAAHTALLQRQVDALANLADVCAEDEPDFCLLLSSTASALGGMGLGAYAAANAYTDAFAAYQNRHQAPVWTSFNWDGWLAGASRTAATGEAHARLAVDWAEGLDALERVLSSGLIGQVALATDDLPARLRAMQAAGRKREATEAQTYTVHPRPNLTNPYVAPRTDVERRIAEIWQERLGIEQVGIHDNYFDLGGDSLLVVKIRRALQEQFGGDLLNSDLFEHPTVAALAAHFQNEAEADTAPAIKDRAARQLAAVAAEQAAAAAGRNRRRRR